jgi:hypothetical protein
MDCKPPGGHDSHHVHTRAVHLDLHRWVHVLLVQQHSESVTDVAAKQRTTGEATICTAALPRNDNAHRVALETWVSMLVWAFRTWHHPACC